MPRSARVFLVYCYAVAALVFCLHATALAQSNYTIVDLGTIPGNPYTNPASINRYGQITGTTANDGDMFTRAFLYSGDTLGALGVLDPDYLLSYSNGYSINASGQIAGISSYPDTIDLQPASYTHAVVFSGSSIVDLGTLGGHNSWAYGINALGQVTGYSTVAGETAVHAFIYRNGAMRDLGTLPGYDSHATAINDFGQVTGYLSKTCVENAFLYSGGRIVDLGTLGGYLSAGHAINNWGQIVGFSQMVPSCYTLGAVHGFLYSGGRMRDLGTLGGDYSDAAAINNLGQVVGTSTLSNGSSHAFLYTPARGMLDLNLLLPTGSGWTLSSAAAINDFGQITGNGISPDGYYRGYLLSPPMLPMLIKLVQSLSVSSSIKTSLITELRAASASGQGSGSYCNDLLQFIAEVQSLSGNKLSASQADGLTAMANLLAKAANCY